MKNRRIPPLYPLLFAVSPVLAVYSRNIDNVPIGGILRPLALSLVLAAVVLCAAALLLRDRAKAGLSALIVIVLLSSLGHVLTGLNRITSRLGFRIDPATHPAAALCAGVGVAVLLLVLIARTRRDLSGIARFLAAMGVILTLMTLMMVALSSASASMRQRQYGGWQKVIAQSRKDAAGQFGADRRGPKPDIYYIILDAYARDDVLKNTYGYDNSPFLRYLTRKGFYVASNSRCNYPFTDWSLSSSLNFDYLDNLVRRAGIADRELTTEPVWNSSVCRVLIDRGYRYAILNSGYSVTSGSRYAGVALPRQAADLSELERGTC